MFLKKLKDNWHSLLLLSVAYLAIIFALIILDVMTSNDHSMVILTFTGFIFTFPILILIIIGNALTLINKKMVLSKKIILILLFAVIVLCMMFYITIHYADYPYYPPWLRELRNFLFN